MTQINDTAEREIRQLPVDAICPDPRHPALKISRSDVKRAAARIKKCFGAPLPVCPAPACDLYILTGDELRFRAALLLGYRSVPCEIFDENVVSVAKFGISDPKFLFNSIERLVSTSSRAGLDVKIEKTESETAASATVTVQKPRS